MMKLAVISHKPCWVSRGSASGFATDGGFPIQMRAISELFDRTTVLVPSYADSDRAGELPLIGTNLSVVALTPPAGRGLWRKLLFPFWLLANLRMLVREVRRADAVHTPIPGDIGTIGIFLALLLRKHLFVRHCGNWLGPRTAADRCWKWLLERVASDRRVVFATGGAAEAPSRRNRKIEWIFASSLTEKEILSRARPREGFGAEQPRLVIACRQERDKGTAAVIGSLLLTRRDFPEATLDVVGDGSALEGLRRLARDLGLDEAVTFSGKLEHDEVLERMSRADLFCYPTESSDGFPKVVLEALACGLPVVATRVSVLPRLIGVGAGILVEESSAEAVAEGIRLCLSDRERYRAMSRCAVATARQYSLEKWRDAIGDRLRLAWGPLQCASSPR
jgi:glycosyltransferase involved in cell wall biosynthesis